MATATTAPPTDEFNSIAHDTLTSPIHAALDIEGIADGRTGALKQLDDALNTINQAFADEIRAAIDGDPDENMTTAAKKAKMSRQTLHDILRRYPAAA